MKIRPFTPVDYEAMTEVYNRIYPDYAGTAESWQREDEEREEKCRWRHYVCEVDTEIVAVATYSQNPWAYDPHKFNVIVYVVPEHRRQGIGTALLREVVAALQPFSPRTLKARTREDHDGGAGFLLRHGFVEVERDWESRLNPGTVDLAAYNGLGHKVASQGIRITTLRALREEDPDYARKLFELDWEASQDVPMAEQLTKPSFDGYERSQLQSPQLMPDAWFVAVTENGDYVGTSNLWSDEVNEGSAYVGFTGVRREYRRRGIALALKLETIAYAQDHGYLTLKTWNAQKNRPMLTINEMLGFVKEPAWISFIKELA